VSLTLSFTHVTIAVLIAALSLPLVSIALGSVGRAPLLEDVSRGLLGLIGVWMIWRAFRHGHHHHKHEGEAVGVMAGLIPCPLTLFAMTFAISKGVPVAGILFAITMMAGVALTLSCVAVLSILFRERLVHFFDSRPRLFDIISRTIEGIAGLILAGVAVWQISLN
jgi:ABC-type nickel/cobalt efflux system permease component RcnA